MFATPFAGVDLDALLRARGVLERALVAETGVARLDAQTGTYSVRLGAAEPEEAATTSSSSSSSSSSSPSPSPSSSPSAVSSASFFTGAARADRDAEGDENANVASNGGSFDCEYAATSPTSIADRQARGIRPAGMDRVLEIRMQCMAVRIMIGLVMRLGLAKVRCKLLDIGARWMQMRANAGVARANEIYLTDQNAVQVSCALSEALDGDSGTYDGESAPGPESTASGARSNSKAPLPPALRIEPRPPMDFDFATAPLDSHEPARGRSRARQRRFVRSRLLQSSMASSSTPGGGETWSRKGGTPGGASTSVFERDKSWEQQLRKSKPASPSKSTAMSVGGHASPAGSQRRRARTPTARDMQLLQRSRRGSNSSDFVEAVVRRAISPMSARTQPVNSHESRAGGGHDMRAEEQPRSRARSNSPAALRRRMSQAYGNFYSQQNARKQAQRAKQIQSNAESMLSSSSTTVASSRVTGV